MTSQMLIRLSSETKEKLDRIARNQGKSTSQVVRELIRDYIQDRDIGAYIDDLWSRIGKKLKSKEIHHKDITEIVRQVRESKK
jgi:predicted DNA-binding protein